MRSKRKLQQQSSYQTRKDLKIRKVARDKEGHYKINDKGSIQEEGITIVNIYAPNIGEPQYIGQTLTDIKREIDSNTIIIGDFNTPLTPMDRSSKQKINKETQVLHDTLDEMDLLISSGHSIQMQKNTHLLLKCTWNILQDRPHLGSQIKPQ